MNNTAGLIKAQRRVSFCGVELSYDMECEPEEWEALQLERYINQERNPELREALEDLDEFLFG